MAGPPSLVHSFMTSRPSSWHAWYGVILLLGIYINSFLDRTILTLLVGPIRDTMDFSDTQVGFLIGPAFAIFYTIAGLPLGWLADRMSRRWLIVIGQAFWSLASVSFGLGRNFFQLALARIGVGVGEATLTPAAYSIITDLFPLARLGRALSVYSMGIQIGGGLASLLGGFLIGWVGESSSYKLPIVGERHMWQIVFFLVAVPTIPLTLLLLTTFREPARRDHDETGEHVAVAHDVTSSEFFRYFRSNAGAFLCHNFGFGLLALSGLAAFSRIPEFFIRIHGWERAFTGKALGLNSMIVGIAGLYFGGWLGDRWARLGRTDSKLRVGLAAVAIGKQLGARVIAAASSEQKLAVCRACGADETIDYSAENLKQQIKALAPGGADIVLDPVGGPHSEAAYRAMRWRGRYVVVGFASGEIPRIPLNLVLLKGADLRGFDFRPFAANAPNEIRKAREELTALLASGKIRPHISAVYSLDEAIKALADVSQRRATGKVVIEIARR